MAQRILVPLDGSATAEAILTRIRPLLKQEDVEVVLVRGVELPPVTEFDYGAIPVILREDAEKYSREMEKKLADQGLRVRPVVRVGPAASIILDAAEELKATMIAMTTHGRTGLARWVMGSVAEKVLRASTVPVLLLRSFDETKPRPEVEEAFDRIIIPIDGSRSCLEVLPHAVALARRFGSRILLVTVQEAGFPGGSYEGRSIKAPAKAPQLADHPSPVEVSRYAEETLAAEKIPVASFTLAGDPASRILEFAREQKGPLIAMTTHGRSGLSRWVFGSVTEKVLRASEAPVLVIRSVEPQSKR